MEAENINSSLFKNFKNQPEYQPFQDNQCFTSGDLSPMNYQMSSPTDSPADLHLSEEKPKLALYSTSGFDLLDVLAKVATRPNPQITIGPVDMSCAFLVSDAKEKDFPIIYASQSFESLTGYRTNEILGKNCRFLQSPNGHVTSGSTRKYTDNTVVKELKTSMILGKEMQCQIVNYKKGGIPFLNLITIVPIMQGGDIRYFVGFQCDLVETPSTIIENMKNGTFGVSYTRPQIMSTVSSKSVDARMIEGMPYSAPYNSCVEAFELITGKTKNEESEKDWSLMLIEKCVDFIHVLSLKGTFLYASPSSKGLLGYDQDELIGTNIADLCHSGDLVPIMREIKDANNQSQISLLYRIKTKNKGYIWMESIGQLHNDGSARKSIVFSGRIRPLFQLSNKALEINGGIKENELWTKLSPEGLFLYSTKTCLDLMGYKKEDLIGTSFYKFIKSDKTTVLSKAIENALQGVSNRIQLIIQTKKGTLQPFTCSFFPANNNSNEFVLCQIFTENRLDYLNSPNSMPSTNAPSPIEIDSTGLDLFQFLNPSNKTTWQFELNQLKLSNKKLKEEIATIQQDLHQNKKRRLGNEYRQCLNCNATNTPEWRRGPKGPKTLCNSCGLKYAKTISTSNSMDLNFPQRNTSF